MDWLRNIPIGQFVDGESSWLRILDPRIKFSWVLMFLLTPVLANAEWRLSLVIALLIITFLSYLPLRIWWRSVSLLLIFSLGVGMFAMFLPTSELSSTLNIRPPDELSGVVLESQSWDIFSIGPLRLGGFSIGPLIIDRGSLELGIKTFTLLFTIVHSVNLMLITTPPENLVWALRWFLSPLNLIGLPIDRLSFQLLLALRFIPLVQEEVQNLIRSLLTRTVNFRRLGFKPALGLFLSVWERLFANILLRAEQGASSLIARNGAWIPIDHLKAQKNLNFGEKLLNCGSILLLLICIALRAKYGRN